MKKNRQSFLWLLFIGLLLSGFTMAQERVVTGKVTESETGEGIPGVNVVIKGSTTGTVTDVNGDYTLEISSEEAILVYSYVGFLSQEIAVGARSIINVTLEPDVQQLQEVVVVGYGTTDYKELTSAISTVKPEEIVKTPNANVLQSLQGKVPGVQIVSNGRPGDSPTMRIRGVQSFENNGTPLFVVDGSFFDNIDFLNSNDIESMSILKDASASSIYGSRASNGVVIIETRSGSYNQKAQISYSGYYGMQVPQNVLKMSNSAQFIQYVNETGDPADISFVDAAMQRYGRSEINPNVPNVNTDWYSEIMAPAPQQSHSITITGGTENTRYSIGGSYFKQDGFQEKIRDDYQRFNIRTRIDTKVNDWLDVGGTVNASIAEKFEGEDGAWFQAYFAVPTLPVFDDQNIDASPIMYGNAKQLGYRGRQNPFWTLSNNDNRRNIYKVNGNIYLDFDIIENQLSFKTAYNYSTGLISTRNMNFAFNDGVDETPQPSLRKEKNNYFNQVWDNYLTYENDFGPHGITLVAGHEWRSDWNEFLFANGTGGQAWVRGQEENWYLNSPGTVIDVLGVNDGNNNNSGLFYNSFFGRAAYNYDGRYLFYTTFRNDAQNKFQKDNENFLTVGAGWVISEEGFFNLPQVNFLKLRVGWGQLGNDGVEATVGAVTLDPSETAIDDVLVDGSTVTPVFDLVDQIETAEETNIGISATLFENLSIEADYFVRNIENLAVTVELPVIRDRVRRSIGEMQNKGFELGMTWNGNIGNDISYFINGNMATLDNKVKGIGGASFLNQGSAEFRQILLIDEPYQAYYGYEINGVFQNTAEITNSGYTTEFITDNSLEPGDFFFKDQNGDGEVNDLDRVVLGSFIPDFTWGFGLGASWKSFSLSIDFQGQSGFEILNRKRGEIIFTNDTNIDADLSTGLWRGEGTSNKYPSAAGIRKGWNQNMSDYYVEDGSYFRIQNVRLAYNIDTEKWGSGLPQATVYFTAEKPLTVFDYNGFNPEVANGIDRQVYPVPAIYILGLDVTF